MAEYQTIQGGKLVDNGRNDGDSFDVVEPGVFTDGSRNYRLYGVDTIENDPKLASRIIDQSRNFGMSIPEARKLASKATKRTQELLSKHKYELIHRGELAEGSDGKSSDRTLALVRFPEFAGTDKEFLQQILVSEGLAQVRGMMMDVPTSDGNVISAADFTNQLRMLSPLESKGKSGVSMPFTPAQLLTASKFKEASLDKKVQAIDKYIGQSQDALDAASASGANFANGKPEKKLMRDTGDRMLYKAIAQHKKDFGLTTEEVTALMIKRRPVNETVDLDQNAKLIIRDHYDPRKRGILEVMVQDKTSGTVRTVEGPKEEVMSNPGEFLFKNKDKLSGTDRKGWVQGGSILSNRLRDLGSAGVEAMGSFVLGVTAALGDEDEDGFAAGLGHNLKKIADSVQARRTLKGRLREFAPTIRERLPTTFTQGLGQMLPNMVAGGAIFRGAKALGLGTKAAGVATATGVSAVSFGQITNEVYNKAIQLGAKPEEARRTGMIAGASEFWMDSAAQMLGLKLIANRGSIALASQGKFLKTLGKVAGIGAAMAGEGVTEGAQELTSNYILKKRISDEVDLKEGVLESSILGTLVGGAVVGGGALSKRTQKMDPKVRALIEADIQRRVERETSKYERDQALEAEEQEINAIREISSLDEGEQILQESDLFAAMKSLEESGLSDVDAYEYAGAYNELKTAGLIPEEDDGTDIIGSVDTAFGEMEAKADAIANVQDDLLSGDQEKVDKALENFEKEERPAILAVLEQLGKEEDQGTPDSAIIDADKADATNAQDLPVTPVPKAETTPEAAPLDPIAAKRKEEADAKKRVIEENSAEGVEFFIDGANSISRLKEPAPLAEGYSLESTGITPQGAIWNIDGPLPFQIAAADGKVRILVPKRPSVIYTPGDGKMNKVFGEKMSLMDDALRGVSQTDKFEEIERLVHKSARDLAGITQTPAPETTPTQATPEATTPEKEAPAAQEAVSDVPSVTIAEPTQTPVEQLTSNRGFGPTKPIEDSTTDLVEQLQEIEATQAPTTPEPEVQSVSQVPKAVKDILGRAGYQISDKESDHEALFTIAGKILSKDTSPKFIDEATEALFGIVAAKIGVVKALPKDIKTTKDAIRAVVSGQSKPKYVDTGLWNKVKLAVSEFVALLTGNKAKQLELKIDKVLADVLTRPEQFSFQPREGFEEIRFQSLLNRSPAGRNVIEIASASPTKPILTGSIAYAEQVTVYRPKGEEVHDIDLLFASEEAGEAFKNELKEQRGELTEIYNFIPQGEGSATHVMGYVSLDKGHKIADLKEKKVKTKNGIVPTRFYTVQDSSGKTIGRYELKIGDDGKPVELRGGETTGAIVDIIIAPTQVDAVSQGFTKADGTPASMNVAPFQSGFLAKFQAGRLKDYTDGNLAKIKPKQQLKEQLKALQQTKAVVNEVGKAVKTKPGDTSTPDLGQALEAAQDTAGQTFPATAGGIPGGGDINALSAAFQTAVTRKPAPKAAPKKAKRPKKPKPIDNGLRDRGTTQMFEASPKAPIGNVADLEKQLQRLAAGLTAEPPLTEFAKERKRKADETGFEEAPPVDIEAANEVMTSQVVAKTTQTLATEPIVRPAPLEAAAAKVLKTGVAFKGAEDNSAEAQKERKASETAGEVTPEVTTPFRAPNPVPWLSGLMRERTADTTEKARNSKFISYEHGNESLLSDEDNAKLADLADQYTQKVKDIRRQKGLNSTKKADLKNLEQLENELREISKQADALLNKDDAPGLVNEIEGGQGKKGSSPVALIAAKVNKLFPRGAIQEADDLPPMKEFIRDLKAFSFKKLESRGKRFFLDGDLIKGDRLQGDTPVTLTTLNKELKRKAVEAYRKLEKDLNVPRPTKPNYIKTSSIDERANLLVNEVYNRLQALESQGVENEDVTTEGVVKPLTEAERESLEARNQRNKDRADVQEDPAAGGLLGTRQLDRKTAFTEWIDDLVRRISGQIEYYNRTVFNTPQAPRIHDPFKNPGSKSTPGQISHGDVFNYLVANLKMGNIGRDDLGVPKATNAEIKEALSSMPWYFPEPVQGFEESKKDYGNRLKKWKEDQFFSDIAAFHWRKAEDPQDFKERFENDIKGGTLSNKKTWGGDSVRFRPSSLLQNENAGLADAVQNTLTGSQQVAFNAVYDAMLGLDLNMDQAFRSAFTYNRDLAGLKADATDQDLRAKFEEDFVAAADIVLNRKLDSDSTAVAIEALQNVWAENALNEKNAPKGTGTESTHDSSGKFTGRETRSGNPVVKPSKNAKLKEFANKVGELMDSIRYGDATGKSIGDLITKLSPDSVVSNLIEVLNKVHNLGTIQVTTQQMDIQGFATHPGKTGNSKIVLNPNIGQEAWGKITMLEELIHAAVLSARLPIDPANAAITQALQNLPGNLKKHNIAIKTQDGLLNLKESGKITTAEYIAAYGLSSAQETIAHAIMSPPFAKLLEDAGVDVDQLLKDTFKDNPEMAESAKKFREERTSEYWAAKESRESQANFVASLGDKPSSAPSVAGHQQTIAKKSMKSKDPLEFLAERRRIVVDSQPDLSKEEAALWKDKTAKMVDGLLSIDPDLLDQYPMLKFRVKLAVTSLFLPISGAHTRTLTYNIVSEHHAYLESQKIVNEGDLDQTRAARVRPLRQSLQVTENLARAYGGSGKNAKVITDFVSRYDRGDTNSLSSGGRDRHQANVNKFDERLQKLHKKLKKLKSEDRRMALYANQQFSIRDREFFIKQANGDEKLADKLEVEAIRENIKNSKTSIAHKIKGPHENHERWKDEARLEAKFLSKIEPVLNLAKSYEHAKKLMSKVLTPQQEEFRQHFVNEFAALKPEMRFNTEVVRGEEWEGYRDYMPLVVDDSKTTLGIEASDDSLSNDVIGESGEKGLMDVGDLDTRIHSSTKKRRGLKDNGTKHYRSPSTSNMAQAYASQSYEVTTLADRKLIKAMTKENWNSDSNSKSFPALVDNNAAVNPDTKNIENTKRNINAVIRRIAQKTYKQDRGGSSSHIAMQAIRLGTKLAYAKALVGGAQPLTQYAPGLAGYYGLSLGSGAHLKIARVFAATRSSFTNEAFNQFLENHDPYFVTRSANSDAEMAKKIEGEALGSTSYRAAKKTINAVDSVVSGALEWTVAKPEMILLKPILYVEYMSNVARNSKGKIKYGDQSAFNENIDFDALRDAKLTVDRIAAASDQAVKGEAFVSRDSGWELFKLSHLTFGGHLNSQANLGSLGMQDIAEGNFKEGVPKLASVVLQGLAYGATNAMITGPALLAIALKMGLGDEDDEEKLQEWKDRNWKQHVIHTAWTSGDDALVPLAGPIFSIPAATDYIAHTLDDIKDKVIGDSDLADSPYGDTMRMSYGDWKLSSAFGIAGDLAFEPLQTLDLTDSMVDYFSIVIPERNLRKPAAKKLKDYLNSLDDE